MVLRRIRHRLANHDWLHAAVDLIIVVAGVFLGMQANNWNEERLQRQRGEQSRLMLIDDLAENQQNLAVRTHYYQWVRSEALKTLAAMGKPASQLGDQFLVDAYQSSQILPWSLKRNTYDQILSVGGMAEIGGPHLQDQITNYYEGAEVTGVNLATVPPYHEILRRVMPYAAQLEIRTACGEKIGEDSRGQVIMTLPKACTIHLDPATSQQAIRQVRGAPGLALDLNRLLVDLDQKLVSTDVISRRARVLQKALEQSAS
jgi:hypothetical protein